MKFTREQVIEMAKAAGLSIDCRNAIDGDEVVQEAYWRVITDEISRLCTLAADRALEAAAGASDSQIQRWVDDRARYAASECATAIRAMKEHQ